MEEGKVVDDLLAPVMEMASSGTITRESGEQRFVGKSAGAHSGEVAQPSESACAKHVDDWPDTAAGTDGFVGHLSVSSEADAEDVSEASHLEGF